MQRADGWLGYGVGARLLHGHRRHWGKAVALAPVPPGDAHTPIVATSYSLVPHPSSSPGLAASPSLGLLSRSPTTGRAGQLATSVSAQQLLQSSSVTGFAPGVAFGSIGQPVLPSVREVRREHRRGPSWPCRELDCCGHCRAASHQWHKFVAPFLFPLRRSLLNGIVGVRGDPGRHILRRLPLGCVNVEPRSRHLQGAHTRLKGSARRLSPCILR